MADRVDTRLKKGSAPLGNGDGGPRNPTKPEKRG
jgi:hypothetical protein